MNHKIKKKKVLKNENLDFFLFNDENDLGRNLDYGSKKSDSHEGMTAKTTLLTMAKDLYELYCTLNDEDDLPEWCHYKLATSSKDLSDITDYLTSKIMKHCIDNKLSENNIRKIIKNNIINKNINEGLFDNIVSKTKKIFSKKEKTTLDNQKKITLSYALKKCNFDNFKDKSYYNVILFINNYFQNISSVEFSSDFDKQVIEDKYNKFNLIQDVIQNFIYSNQKLELNEEISQMQRFLKKEENLQIQKFLKKNEFLKPINVFLNDCKSNIDLRIIINPLNDTLKEINKNLLNLISYEGRKVTVPLERHDTLKQSSIATIPFEKSDTLKQSSIPTIPTKTRKEYKYSENEIEDLGRKLVIIISNIYEYCKKLNKFGDHPEAEYLFVQNEKYYQICESFLNVLNDIRNKKLLGENKKNKKNKLFENNETDAIHQQVGTLKDKYFLTYTLINENPLLLNAEKLAEVIASNNDEPKMALNKTIINLNICTKILKKKLKYDKYK